MGADLSFCGRGLPSLIGAPYDNTHRRLFARAESQLRIEVGLELGEVASGEISRFDRLDSASRPRADRGGGPVGCPVANIVPLNRKRETRDPRAQVAYFLNN